MSKRKASTRAPSGPPFDPNQVSYQVFYNGQDTGRHIRTKFGTPVIWIVDDDPEESLNQTYGPGMAAQRAVKLWRQGK